MSKKPAQMASTPGVIDILVSNAGIARGNLLLRIQVLCIDGGLLS